MRAELLAGPMSEESINEQLDTWTAQIADSVAEAADAHADAPSVDTWNAAVETLADRRDRLPKRYGALIVNDTALLIADGVAVIILAFGLYFPRYHRRDMVLAIVSINVGVLAVALVLSRADVTAGLGLGLFGVLSIIRLRSQELDQEEVAYYFSAIALGLLGGCQDHARTGSRSR